MRATPKDVRLPSFAYYVAVMDSTGRVTGNQMHCQGNVSEDRQTLGSSASILRATAVALVVVVAGLATGSCSTRGVDRGGEPAATEGAILSSPEAASGAQPPASRGAFVCPSPSSLQTATGLDFGANTGSDAMCIFKAAAVEGDLVIMHPPYSVGSQPETLADYHNDFKGEKNILNATTEERPDIGDGAFSTRTESFCTMWLWAVDGQVVSVQANRDFGATDRCDLAAAVAELTSGG